MTYTVWIVVEDEDSGDTSWWSVDHHPTRAEAEENALAIAEAEYNRTGVEPQRLDD